MSNRYQDVGHRRRNTRNAEPPTRGLEITRRAVLQGGGALAADYATGVLAEDTNSTERWYIDRDGDPRVAERQVYYLSYRAAKTEQKEVWILPEIAFGEIARIYVEPRPLDPGEAQPADPSRIDQRVTVIGINLTGDGRAAFNLIIDLRYGGKDRQTPIMTFCLEGWVFKGARRMATLQGDAARKPSPVELAVDTKAVSRFVEEIFGTRVRLAPKSQPLFAFETPTAAVSPDYIVWRIAGRTDKGAILEIPPFAEGDGKPVVTAHAVNLSRIADERRPDDATDDTDRTGQPLSRPKTVAWLARPTFADPLIIGMHRTPEKARLRVELRSLRLGCDGQDPTLTRGADGDVVFRAMELSASLYVVDESGGASRAEGPFQVYGGQLAAVGPANGGGAELTGDFDLFEKRALLHSSFGPLEIEAPEQKRTLPPLSPLGGTEQQRAPAQNPLARAVSVSATGGRLTAFATVARVTSAAVGLVPDTHGQDPTRDYRIDLSFGGGAETLFFLHGLADRASVRPSIGRVALGASPTAKPAHGEFGPLYSLPLESAMLRLTRWRDLAALSFRFAGLDLTFETGAFMMRPRGLARQSTSIFPGSAAPTMSGAVVDTRPLMVVDLPPQHVAEEAFFVQRALRPQPPDYPLEELAAVDRKAADEARAKFAQLRALYLRDQDALDSDAEHALAKHRAEARDFLKGVIDTHFPKPTGAVQDFVEFTAAFKKVTKDKKLPAEQLTYVGPEFLDPQARLYAEKARDIQAPGTPMFDYLPEDPVSDDEFEGIQNTNPKPSYDKAKDVADARRNLRDPAYLPFQRAWASACHTDPPPDLKDTFARYCTKLSNLDDFKVFSGRAKLLQAVEKARVNNQTSIDDIHALDATMKWLWDTTIKTLGLSGVEEPTPVSRHFSSGPSRLAFRINTDDARDDQGGAFPLSADNLTNWSRHELVVVRRAQKLFKAYADGTRRPAWDRAEDDDLADQLLAQGFSRSGFDRDLAESGERSRDWPSGFVTAEQRLAEVAALATAPPTDFETSIELPSRLHLPPSQDGRFRTRRVVRDWVFEGATVPGDTLKAIAEPLWTAEFEIQPNSALRAVWSPDFRPEAFRAGGFSSECPTSVNDDPLDMARADRPPPHGPFAPWMINRGVADCSPVPWGGVDMRPLKFRTSLDAYDRHELVTLSSVHGLPVIGKLKDESGLRTGIDQRRPPNGFQVATGGWGVDAAGRRDSLRQNDIYVPPPFDVEGLELAMSSLGGFLRVNAHFDPPASVLDGKGASYFPALSIERWRHRIVLGRDISAEVVYKGYLFPIGQRAALVKITERRFEKVAGRHGPVAVLRQRMFLRLPNRPKTYGAFRQADSGRRLPFTELRVTTLTTPDIVDPYDNANSSMPHPRLDADVSIYESGRLDYGGGGLAFWPRVAKRQGSEVKFDFLLDGNVSTRLPFIFVDNIVANNKEWLAAIARYYSRLSGELTEHDCKDPCRGDPPPGLSLVAADIKGAKLTYAPEAKSGDTRYETYNLVLAAEGRGADTIPRTPASDDVTYRPLVEHGKPSSFLSDPFMQGADQPPFYPAMRYATIRAAQIERLTGRPLGPVMVAFDPSYARAGFDAPAPDEKSKLSRYNAKDIFLSIISTTPPNLDFGSAGDRGGAVARPQSQVLALSRVLGPIGVSDNGSGTDYPKRTNDYDAPPAVAYWYDAQDKLPVPQKASALPIIRVSDDAGAGGKVPAALTAFFDPNAKLLGLVSLMEVIGFLGGEDAFPVLHELNEFGGNLAGATDQQVRDNVLQPLRDALVALQKRIDGIDQTIVASTPQLGTKGPSKASLTVKEVYHDVYTTLQALILSLNAALGGPSATDAASALAQAGVYSAIYANGKAFLAALEKAVRDPATPLAQKAQDYLKSLEDELTTLIQREIHASLGVLAALDDAARLRLARTLRDALVNEIIAPLFGILFPPPPAAMISADPTKDFKQTLLAGLTAPGVWPMLDTPAGATVFDPMAFEAYLEEHNFAKDNAKAYLGSDALQLATQVGRAIEIIDSLGATKGEPDVLLDALKAFADPVQKVLAIAKLSNALRNACQAGANVAVKYVALLKTGGAAAVDALAVSFSDAQSKISKNSDRIKTALQALKTKFANDPNLGTLIDPLTTDFKAFQDAVSNDDISVLCKSLSDKLGNLNIPDPAALCGGSPDTFVQSIKGLREIQSVRNGLIKALNTRATAIRDLVHDASYALPQFIAKMNGSTLFAPDLDDTWPLPVPVLGTAESLAALAATLAADLLITSTPLLTNTANTLSAATLAKVLVDDQTTRDFLDAYDAFDKIWPSAIGTAPIKIALPDGSAALKASFDSSGFEQVRKMVTDLSALAMPLSNNVTDWSNYANRAFDASTHEADLRNALAGLTKVLGDTNEPLEALVSGAGTWTETRLVLVLAHAGPPKALLADAIAEVAKSLDVAAVPQALQKAFAQAAQARVELANEVFALQSLPLQALTPLRARVRAALTAPDAYHETAASDSLEDWIKSWEGDSLDFQTNQLGDIAKQLDPAGKSNAFVGILSFADLLSGWTLSPTAHISNTRSGAPNAILVIISQCSKALSDILGDILRGHIGSLIDFDAVKREIERQLRQFVPTRQTLTYDLDVKLQNFPNGDDDNAIFLPGDSRLTLRSRASIDLLNPARPEITANGVIGPFKVKLLAGFMDIVTLSFDGARFGSDTGGRLKANVTGVELGEAVQFLEQLSSFFSFGENGFYLRVLFDPPGIEAGYAMPPMGFALGVLGISNISLNAGVLIPFTDAPAMFTVGLSSPERPFLINATVYGGGGHLKLYASAQGIVGFEASFEAGAVVAFTIGILEGQGRVTFGIFLRSFKADKNTVSTVEGMVTAAGAASIAMFHVSAMLQVRAGQMADGSMQGTATFTFSFSVGLTSVDFRVTARHNMGKGFAMGSGGPLGGSGAIDGKTMFAETGPTRLAFNEKGPVLADADYGTARTRAPMLISNVVCKGDDYELYDAYFRPESPQILDIWNRS